MSERYPGGFITKTPPTLNPALGNSTPGVWTLDQVMQNIKAGTWPAYDPYFEYTTLLLHGNGTNGAQNNTFLDSSTNNFTITRNGNTTQGTFTPYGSNWSNFFSSSQLSVANSTNLDLGSGNWTIEAWLYPTSFADYARFFSKQASSGLGFIARLQITTGYVFLEIDQTGIVTSSTAPALNTWSHVAIVRNSNTVTIYINGTSAGSASYSGTPSSQTAKTTISGFDSGPSQGEYFPGYISNLRYVKGSAVYTSNFTPSTAPLTAITNTQLLTCQNNRFIDNSSNAFTVTVNVGSPSVQRFSPFSSSAAYAAGTIGGSGYFDGSGDSLQAPSGACISGTGDFTAECWVFPTAVPGSYNIIGCSDSSNGLTMFGLNANGTIFYGRSGVSVQGTTSNSLNFNTWNHIAISRSSSTLKMFINGVQGFSGTETYSYASGTVRIGTDIGGSSLPYTGYISDFRIIQGSAIYTTGFTPPTAPLTAVSGTSLLLNMTNGGIIDNAMMNDLETVGNAQISTTQSKFGGASMYFDGTGDYLVGNANAPVLDSGSGQITIEGWFYLTANIANGAFGQVVGPIGASGTSGLAFGFSGSGGTTRVAASYVSTGYGGTVAISLNTWTHVAWVLTTSTTLKTYINGTLADTFTLGGTQNVKGIFVGAGSGGASPITGYIDDLRITKGIARYTSNFTPQTSQWQDQ